MKPIGLLRRLRYLLDELFAREFAGQILFLLIGVSALTLLGATAVLFGLFSPENASLTGLQDDAEPGWLQGMWWSLLQVLNLPGFRNARDASGPIMVYAFILSLASLAVFALLISIIRTAIARRLEALSRGDTPVIESGHLLILGWNDTALAVLKQLSVLARGRTVTILSEESVRSLQNSLRLAGIDRKALKMVLRTGNPSEPAELLRVAVDQAACIIVPSGDTRRSTRAADNQVLRTLTLLAARESWQDDPPSVVAEIADVRNHELAEIASGGRLFLVKSGRVLGKLLVQCACYPGLSELYRQLFELNDQNLRVSFQPRYQGRSIGELHARLERAILLGVVEAEFQPPWKSYRATLNPPDDHCVTSSEGIVYLSATERPALAAASDKPVNVTEPAPDNIESAGSDTTPEHVLVVGWNNDIYDVIREFNDQVQTRRPAITVLTTMPVDLAQAQFEEFSQRNFEALQLTFIQGAADRESGYGQLDMTRFDCVLVLADQTIDDPDVDAHTLRVLLQLSQLKMSADTRLVVQLLDAGSRALMHGLKVDEIVVSNEVISAQLSQIALHRSLGGVYPALMSAEGIEIVAQPLSAYTSSTSCGFAGVAAAARQHNQIALGVYQPESRTLLLNPDSDALAQFSLQDRLVVLAQRQS